MSNVINIGTVRSNSCRRNAETIECSTANYANEIKQNSTAQDISATIHMKNIMDELEERTSWMKDLDVIPTHLRTGDDETDVTGIALAMNNLGEKVTIALGGFEIIVDFFNLQLMTLDEVQRERVLGNLSKHTATALLLLDFSEKLKAAELGPMVDEALKARC